LSRITQAYFSSLDEFGNVKVEPKKKKPSVKKPKSMVGKSASDNVPETGKENNGMAEAAKNVQSSANDTAIEIVKPEEAQSAIPEAGQTEAQSATPMDIDEPLASVVLSLELALAQ
jgi:hypothetical protein